MLSTHPPLSAVFLVAGGHSDSEKSTQLISFSLVRCTLPPPPLLSPSPGGHPCASPTDLVLCNFS